MSVIDEKWNYSFDQLEIENAYFREFEIEINNLSEHILDFLDDFKNKCFSYTNTPAKTYATDFETIVEKNKQLRHELDQLLAKKPQLQTKYASSKKDVNLLTQEIKETYEAYLMAKKFYKKFLKIYYTIETKNGDQQIIFLQFFTETKKDTENYSVRLRRNMKSGKYELLSTTPKLSKLIELQKQIQDTSNVPGVLNCIRQEFIEIKKKA